jgi:hypothetical protein
MAVKLEQEEKETLFLFMNAILPHFGSRLMSEVASLYIRSCSETCVSSSHLQVWICNHVCFFPLHAFLALQHHVIFHILFSVLLHFNFHQLAYFIILGEKISIQCFVVSVQDNFRVTCTAYGIDYIIDRLAFQVVIWMWARILNVEFCLVIILCF